MATVAYVLARYSRGKFKKFLQGKTSARVQAPMFLAIMAYLESELQEGKYLSELDSKAKPISDRIRTLYSKAMADILLPGTLTEEKAIFSERNDASDPPTSTGSIPQVLNGSAHGAMFHLAMIAYYTMTEELDNVERSVWTRFCNEKEFDDAVDKPTGECRSFIRHVDIVLKSDGAGERWVELKSLKRDKLTKPSIPSSDGFKTWASSRDKGYKSTKYGDVRFGKITYHKQFALDRAAVTIGAKRTTKEVEAAAGSTLAYDLKVDDIAWKFHQFHVKPSNGRKEEKSVQVGKVNFLGNIRERLSDLPDARAKGLGKERKDYSFDVDDGKQSIAERAGFASKVNNFNVLDVLKSRLQASGQLTDELIELLEEQSL